MSLIRPALHCPVPPANSCLICHAKRLADLGEYLIGRNPPASPELIDALLDTLEMLPQVAAMFREREYVGGCQASPW